MTPTPRMAFITVVATLAYLGLAILGWGSFAAFFSHPPLIALVIVGFVLTGVALFSGGNLSPGEREDRGNRWVLAAFGVIGILLAYLPAYTDRKDFWTLDGDAIRWLGVVLSAAGGALRIWPVFVLGHRFSGLVAIQPGHTLVTRGVYGVIRHPSYLGLLVNSLGWALAFRSMVGVLLTALTIPPLIARIHAEERLLRTQFGEQYDAYRSGPHPAARETADPPGLVHTGQQERYDGQYDAYADYEGRDAYQDRYGDDGTTPPAGKPSKPRRTRKNPGGKRRLLIAGTAVVIAGILAAAGYVFVLKPKPSTVTPTSAAPLPSPGTGSAATAACVKQFGQYCHIELRTDDPAPLTLAELFPPAFVNETDHVSFTRAGTKLDTTCSKAVIGQDLTSALQDGKCTQVLRASYFSGDGKMMGTIGVANLSTTNEAHHAGKLVGNSDFVDPLSTTTGVTSKLGKGTGIVEAEYKGHYLIMIWAEFTSTNAPANNTQDQQLQQFGADLIAGTANISLSQRMLNGHPPTAAS